MQTHFWEDVLEHTWTCSQEVDILERMQTCSQEVDILEHACKHALKKLASWTSCTSSPNSMPLALPPCQPQKTKSPMIMTLSLAKSLQTIEFCMIPYAIKNNATLKKMWFLKIIHFKKLCKSGIFNESYSSNKTWIYLFFNTSWNLYNFWIQKPQFLWRLPLLQTYAQLKKCMSSILVR